MDTTTREMPSDEPTETRPAVSRQSAGLRFRDAIALFVASAVVVLLSLSGWVADAQATLVQMGFDPDRGQLLVGMLVAALAAAVARLIARRSAPAILASLLGFTAVYGGTFLSETRDALSRRSGQLRPRGLDRDVVGVGGRGRHHRLGRVGARRNRSRAARGQLERPVRSRPIARPQDRACGPSTGGAGGGRPPGINRPGAWRYAQFRPPDPHAPDNLYASWPLRRGAVYGWRAAFDDPGGYRIVCWRDHRRHRPRTAVGGMAADRERHAHECRLPGALSRRDSDDPEGINLPAPWLRDRLTAISGAL